MSEQPEIFNCRTKALREQDLNRLALENNFYAKMQLEYNRAKRENRETYFNINLILPIVKPQCNHKKLIVGKSKIEQIDTIRAIATQYKAIFDNKTQKWHHFAIDEEICVECGKTVEIKAKFIRATKSHHIMLS